jgi:hypothetical protein
MSCETKSSVTPFAVRSRMRWKHFCWKKKSPTPSASSTMSTSGSASACTAKASRITMPLE